MKKLLLIILLSIIVPNVYAEEYKFLELTKTCEESNVIKCEPVVYNKFYKEEITNFTYEEETYNNEEYPFIDKNDTKILTSNTIEKTGNKENNLYRINFGYEINSISFEGINIDNSNLIKIYYDNKVINEYNTVEKNNYLEFDFNKLLDPRLLSIEVNTESIKDFYIRLKLNNSYIHQANINVDDKISIVNVLYKDTDDYRNFLNELNVNYNDYKLRVKYYENNVILYKFYNIIKTYYKDLDVDYLEGYKYDKEESYTMYRKYEKQIIQDVNLNQSSVNLVKPKSIYYAKPINKGMINSIPLIDKTPKIYRSTSNIKRFNIGKPNIYNKLSNEEKKPLKKNFIFYFLIIICIITLRFFYVKFKYKNAT